MGRDGRRFVWRHILAVLGKPWILLGKSWRAVEGFRAGE